MNVAVLAVLCCLAASALADFAPCAGATCNNPEVFKVCSDGLSAISPAICLKATAKCCIDQDFHGFGRCNRECTTDAINTVRGPAASVPEQSRNLHLAQPTHLLTFSLARSLSLFLGIAQWKSTHVTAAGSSYTDYAPCTGALCNDPDVFKVCSNGLSSISTSLCKQANAVCCIDQDFHGFGRCNRECSADAIDAVSGDKPFRAFTPYPIIITSRSSSIPPFFHSGFP